MDYLQPDNLNEALEAIADDPYGTKVISGGTAVVLMLQNRLIAPDRLVSLARVPGLNYIRQEDGMLHIGPRASLHDAAVHPLVRQRLPALAHACGMVGNVRVRHQATLGGNLAEADYASDPPAVLSALDTVVRVRGRDGERAIPLDEFLLGFYTTALEPEELITDIMVPLPEGDTRMIYLKYKSRSSEDRPCVGVAAVGIFEADTCVDLRVSVGAASEIPRRLNHIEQEVQGQRLDDGLISAVADAYADGIDTLDDLRGSSWYRSEMIRVHVRRAVEDIRHDHR